MYSVEPPGCAPAAPYTGMLSLLLAACVMAFHSRPVVFVFVYTVLEINLKHNSDFYFIINVESECAQ